jgi:hypothetical protein
MKTPPSAEAQVHALLTGRAFAFTCEWTGKVSLDGSEYQEVFTVDRDTVHKFVSEHGLPSGAWSSHPQTQDGLYMIEQDGQYKVYDQERGIQFDESAFASRQDAQSDLVDRLLARSGAGLFVSQRGHQPTKIKRRGWLPQVFGSWRL